MWSLVPRPTQILVVVALGIVSASAAAWIADFAFGQDRAPVFFISIAATTITLLFIPLAQVLWRPLWRLTPAFRRRFPDLNGRWIGEAIPVSPEGGTGETRPATIIIRQGLFDVAVSLTTDQLESHTIRGMLELDPKAHKLRIRYAYDGRPPPELAKANPRHEGAACLEVDLDGDASTLTGRYFTDRATRGTLEFRRERKAAPARRKRRAAATPRPASR